MYQPPKLATKILLWICPKELAEEIEGDFYEAYQDLRANYPVQQAQLLYYWTLVKAIPWILSSTKHSKTQIKTVMYKHYLLTACRSIARYKGTAAINLLGLSLGLASALLLTAFIYNQSLKDADIADFDRYVRVESYTPMRATDGFRGRVHPGIGATLKENLPLVENFVRMNSLDLDVTITGNSYRDGFLDQRFVSTDSTFFTLFPQQFILGNENNAFKDKRSAVLTESAAKRLFGEQNPIGQSITHTQSHRSPLTVTAVVKDPPIHSSVQFDFLYPTMYDYDIYSGGFSPIATYLKLKPGADLEQLAKQSNEIIGSRVTSEYLKSMEYRLSPVAEVKYNMSVLDEVIIPADKSLLTIFTLVAVFILLLAIINYINLSTSKALERVQEVGVRKVMGAGRGSFFYQFITESLLISLIALPLAALIFAAAKPYFENALEQPLAISIMIPELSLFSLSLVIITGLIAGIYPALLISRFQFRDFLSGSLLSHHKGSLTRKALVVFQFSVALTLIICALIVQKQLRFTQQQQLSYQPDQIITLERGLSSNLNLLKEDLKKLPGVQQVSLSSSPPGGTNYAASGTPKGLDELVYMHEVDQDYADILNLEFLSGENFILPYSDEGGMIINETLAKLLETNNPLNIENPLSGKYNFLYSDRSIRAIVKDFHIESLHEKIKPMAFFYKSFKGYNGGRMMIKVNVESLNTLLPEIEEAWYEHVPNSSFGYTFLDQRFARLYTLERRLSQIFNAFTAVAIVISCLGLYGLIAFMVAVKSKEIGIRKVMGASSLQVVQIFTTKMYGLLLIASLIAIPVSYWSIQQWLQGFAYHIPLKGDIFLLAITAVFCVASLTMIIRILRSARANPVDVLRRE